MMTLFFALFLALCGMGAMVVNPLAAMAADSAQHGSTHDEGPVRTPASRKKKIFYLRYSCKQQREASIDAQRRNIMVFLDRLGIDYTGYVEIVDKAASGTSMNRKGFKRLLEMFNRGEIEWIAIDDLSRITRTSILGPLWDRFAARQVRFFSAIDHLDSNDDGAEAIAKFKGVVNEISNKLHARRVLRSLRDRVMVENASVGDRPYGYGSVFVNPEAAARYTGVGPKPEKILVIDDEQAKIVVWIFIAYYEWNWSPAKIARDLNDRNVPLGSRSVSKAEEHEGQVLWSEGYIRELLKQRKFIGDWTWGRNTVKKDAEGNRYVHEAKPGMAIERWLPDMAIVPLALFEKVQEKLAKNKEKYGYQKGQKRRGQKQHDFEDYARDPIASLLYCGICGRKLHYAGSENGVGYRCPVAHSRGKLPDGTVCTNKGWILLERAREALGGHLRDDLLSCREWLGASYESMMAEYRRLLRDTPTELQRLHERRSDLKKDIARIVLLLTKVPNSDALLEELGRKEAEKREVDDAIRLRESGQAAFNALPTLEWIQKALNDLPGILEADKHRAGVLYQSYFGKVMCYNRVAPGKKRGPKELRFTPNRTLLVRAVMPTTVTDEESPETVAVGDQPEVCLYLASNDKLDKLMPTIDAMVKRGKQWREIEKELGVNRGWANKYYRIWKKATAPTSGESAEADIQDHAEPTKVDSMPSVPEPSDVMYAHTLHPEATFDADTTVMDASDNATAS